MSKAQLPYWWGETVTAKNFSQVKKKLQANGWNFVVYTVPERWVHLDRNQLVFRKEKAISSKLVPWDGIPEPKGTKTDRYQYHGRG